MDFLAKKRKAPKKLGKEIWGCDISLHKVTADGMEIGCHQGFPGVGGGGHKIKEEEGRLNMAGRLPNSYFILWMILLGPESIHYAARQTQTKR